MVPFVMGDHDGGGGGGDGGGDGGYDYGFVEWAEQNGYVS